MAQLSAESMGKDGEIIRNYEPLPGVQWRYGSAPDYSKVNKAYFEGRTKVHPEGSLEQIVQQSVKNWEVECHHVEDPEHWKTMKVDEFAAHSNSLRCPYNAARMAKEGTYNMLLGDIGEKEYMGSKETYDTAHENFTKTFSKGFPFEILEVQSGPPVISCTWHHWAEHTGPYRAADGTMYKPTGKLIEMFGSGVIKVNEDMLIKEVQMYFDRGAFVKELMSGGPVDADDGVTEEKSAMI